MQRLSGQEVILGYSGGPDALALLCKMRSCGAYVVPVYIDYRKTAGGKTSKDLRAARISLAILHSELLEVRAPLGDRPKSERNRHFLDVLSTIAKEKGTHFVALGTLRDEGDDDLDPSVLARHCEALETEVITWDMFGTKEKAEEFSGMTEEARRALFKTTSCQMWWNLECGNCHSCIARHNSFLKAFGHDPTTYRMNSRVERQ